MAVVVTAAPDPEFARIRLTVTGAADGPVTITRLDSNGSHLVRQFEGQESAGGSLLVDDYEAALRGDVTYTATDSTPESDTFLVEAALEEVGGPWLTHPNLPALNIPAIIVDDHPTWSRRSTEHLIYGRAAPLYTTQPMQTRTGTLTLRCATWEAVRAVHGLYRRGNAVLLRQPCLTGGDYYHIGDLAAEPFQPSTWGGAWQVTVTYTSVDIPAGELQGSPDWTWDRVVSDIPTWTDLIDGYPTWADLVQGPVPV